MTVIESWGEAYNAGRASAIKEAETAGTIRYVRERDNLLKTERARLTALFEQYYDESESDVSQYLPIRTVIAIINDIELVDYDKDN